MKLKIYNTLSRKKEEFKPIKKNEVGMYSCGPTVYWYQHIGNLRAYFFADILKRTLEFNGYKVKHIINVTDVGHLTSDADTGEDKIEKAAKKEGKTAKEISQHYFDVFVKDLEKLNIIPPKKWTWATKYIEEQINLIKILEKKGFTYQTKTAIYFDTTKFKNYGKFARLNIEGLEEGKRIDIGDKKTKTDFALWKFSEKPGERLQEWDSPWGIGFPGWHIECSAMSLKELGKQLDIHTGGIDHIPIHHTNEIAQNECAFNIHPWVRYWMHSNHLTLKDGKMSKSSGSIITLTELEEKGYSAKTYRYFLLGTHYRKQLIFSYENLNSAKNSLERLENIISELKDDKKTNKKYLEDFQNSINDDLNTPEALQILWKLIRDKNAKGKYNTIKKMDEILGLNLLEKEKIKIPKKVLDLIGKRKEARDNKNWEKSDKLRDQIEKLGFQISDTENGQKIDKIN